MRETPRLQTGRLVVALVQPGMGQALLALQRDNAGHFQPWDPPSPPGASEPAYWQEYALRSQHDFENGSAVRLALFTRDDSSQIIGTATYSQLSRGPFQAAMLGYRIAKAFEGKGYMQEALQATLQYAFDELRLHRIHANYMPENLRSGNLLARLGFTIEGFARNYLYINGAWRDHVLTSLTNQAYRTEWLMPGA